MPTTEAKVIMECIVVLLKWEKSRDQERCVRKCGWRKEMAQVDTFVCVCQNLELYILEGQMSLYAIFSSINTTFEQRR